MFPRPTVAANGPFLLVLLLAALLLLLREERGAAPMIEAGPPDAGAWVRVSVRAGETRLCPFRDGETLGRVVSECFAGVRADLPAECRSARVRPCTEIRIAAGPREGELSCEVLPLPERCRYLHELPVDLNRADRAELALLPGIGDKLAERILRERQRAKGFSSVEDLLRVPGIGAKSLERLRGRVTPGL